MSEIGRELHLTLQAALREAVVRRNPYLTVEHLLYALAHDQRGEEILLHAGAHVPALKAALEKFLADDLERVPGDEPVETRQTLAFHRVLQHALAHCANAEKPEVDAGDLLAALFQEPDSYAVTLLRSQGVSRLDLLHYVSHGISKRRDGAARRRRPRARAWARGWEARPASSPRTRSPPTPATSRSAPRRASSTR